MLVYRTPWTDGLTLDRCIAHNAKRGQRIIIIIQSVIVISIQKLFFIRLTVVVG